MVDPVVSLAVSMHSSRGVYALLLGSGISRSAGIPTGWDVVQDLIERVASASGDSTNGDPLAWHRSKFGTEPNYSDLLSQLGGQPAERQQILRGYFEPTSEESEQGSKVPTAAHRAVAELVRDGYVRVLLTTNFDRLLEQALEGVGVAPTVISSADAAAGALPLAHAPCTLVKLHGDYLDTRIRNTPRELAAYPQEIDTLLDQVLDEYGLVVCGWSGEWDAALRDAVLRCPSRRFTTYWTTRSALQGQAKRLASHRGATVIPITTADHFFTGLVEKIRSLSEMDAPHPMTGRIAVATLKRYLAEERHRIRLRDLLQEETSRVVAETGPDRFPYQGVAVSTTEMTARLARYEGISDTLIQLMATGSYWAQQEQVREFVEVLRRLVDRFTDLPGENAWTQLLWYPATLAMYGGGLGAIAAGNTQTLAHLLGDARCTTRVGVTPLIERAVPLAVIDREVLAPRNPQGGDSYTPISDHMNHALREPTRALFPEEEQYSEAFDRLEYLISIAYMAASGRSDWAPSGRFVWKQRHRYLGDSLANAVEAEVVEAGASWGFLQTELFGGSKDKFLGAKGAADTFLARLPFY